MGVHDLLLIVLAFFSETLGTVSGIGSSTIFVPAAVFLETFQFVLAITAILHCFGNIFRILIFRKDFEARAFFALALPSIIFTGVGAVLVAFIPAGNFEFPLGAALIIIGLFFLFESKMRRLRSHRMGYLLSAISGFMTGFVGTGGAIRAIALTAWDLQKNSFIVISSAIDLGGDLLRAIIYSANGFMDWNRWYFLPLLGLAAWFGARAGKALLSYIDQRQFEKIVAASIILSGVAMLMK